MMRSVRRSTDERHSHTAFVFFVPLVVMFKFGMMTWCLILDGLELFITRGCSCSLRQYNGYIRESYGESNLGCGRARLFQMRAPCDAEALAVLSIVMLLPPHELEDGKMVLFSTLLKLLVHPLAGLTASAASLQDLSRVFEFEFVRGSKCEYYRSDNGTMIREQKGIGFTKPRKYK